MSGSTATVPLLQALGKAVVEAGGVDEAFVRERTESFPRLQGEPGAAAVERPGREQRGPRAPDPRGGAPRDSRTSGSSSAGRWGLTQARERRRQRPRDRQPAALARLDRQARRGRVARCAVTQLAGRPHHGGSGRRPDPAFLEALERATGMVAPRKHGFDTVEAIHALHDGRARLLFALGGTSSRPLRILKYTAGGPCARRGSPRQCLHQAEPRPPGDRVHRADPALPGSLGR